MGKGGHGKGAPSAPARWPRVQTPCDVQDVKAPAIALPVDYSEEPFMLKHAIVEASHWAAQQDPPEKTSPRCIVQSVLSDEEIEQVISSLTPKLAPTDVREETIETATSGMSVEVQVLRMSGDEAFLGMMDSGTTVASLKEKLQETTGIKVGWQVLLLGGLELDHQQTLAAYSGNRSDEKLEFQMQVVKFRDTCHEVAFGQTHERYGALLALLEEAQRGDYCVSCVAGFHLTQRDFQEQQTLSFKLLAQTLPLESACQLLVHALSSRPLLHQAAVNLARLFHEDHEIAASSSQLISGSPYAMELLQRFKVNFKPTPRPYTGARIELPPPRDPLVFAREELASYMAFARALPHNWHYKTCTPVTNGFDLERHLSQEEQRAAAMLMLDLSIVKRRDHWTIVTQNGSSEVVVTLDPCGLFVMEDQRMSEVDLFCGIAEYPHRSAERVRLALECVANLAGKGHRRALAAACWRAGYAADAVVRDAALEVMQRVAEVKDLPEIDDMLQRWWGNDCHAKRIRLEMQRFFGLEVF